MFSEELFRKRSACGQLSNTGYCLSQWALFLRDDGWLYGNHTVVHNDDSMIWIILLWLFFCFAVGQYASNKGHSFGDAFFISFLFSPLVGFIVVLLTKANEKKLEAHKIASGENRQCPYCAELIKAQAIVCRYCGRDLPQEIQSPSSGQSLTKIGSEGIGCAGLLFILGVIVFAIVVWVGSQNPNWGH